MDHTGASPDVASLIRATQAGSGSPPVPSTAPTSPSHRLALVKPGWRVAWGPRHRRRQFSPPRCCWRHWT